MTEYYMQSLNDPIENGLILLGVGLMGFVLYKVWNPEARKKYKKQLVLLAICCAFFICRMGYFACWRVNPDIQVFVGTYEQTLVKRNGNLARWSPRYLFSDEEDSRAFYLDSASRKDLIPEGFREGVVYEIHYEANTEIIVGIAKK